jgi:glutaredoxin
VVDHRYTLKFNYGHHSIDPRQVNPLLRLGIPPKSVTREPAQQTLIDRQTASLTLYQYQACPFCVKVRRAMKRQGLQIETRDVKRNDAAREELLAGGGDSKVPCLIIGKGERPSQWMYESKDIIGYLEGRFLTG